MPPASLEHKRKIVAGENGVALADILGDAAIAAIGRAHGFFAAVGLNRCAGEAADPTIALASID